MRKIRKLTKEHKRKIGLANSISLKGKHLTEKHKQNLREALKGRTFKEESINKMRLAQLGKHHTKETKDKLRIIKSNYYKTHLNPMKDKHYSQEEIEKNKLSH